MTTAPATLPVCYQTGIVPLNQFVLPEQLNGCQGDNRSPIKPLIPAEDDYQAIYCWLSRLEPGSHTYRSYQREVERLLLWAVLIKQKALSSLNMVDMSEYRRFLSDPKPKELWVGAPQKKTHTQWKPFNGVLSSRSRKYSETVINGLFGFLVTQHYCLHNPMQALPRLKNADSHQPIATERSFTVSQWQIITDFINRQIDASSDNERLKWLRIWLILQLGYCTGLRLHELAQATVDDIKIRERQHKRQYWLEVLGKGHKTREVPLPSSVYSLLTETYTLFTGRSLTHASPESLLLPKLRSSGSKALTPPAIYKILRSAFLFTAT
jgi:site-specific recombinase XerD